MLLIFKRVMLNNQNTVNHMALVSIILIIYIGILMVI